MNPEIKHTASDELFTGSAQGRAQPAANERPGTFLGSGECAAAASLRFPPLKSQAEIDREHRRERAVYWAARIAEGIALAVLTVALFTLAACGATSEGRPAIVVSEGYAMVMRETTCGAGVKSGPAFNITCTVKWGK